MGPAAKKNNRRLAVLTILILSPLFAEVLSLDTPFVIMVRYPQLLIAYIAYYGCGTLAIREVAKVWRKGVVSVMLLGEAFGLLEGGLVAKPFFNPSVKSVAFGTIESFATIHGIHLGYMAAVAIFQPLYVTLLPLLAAELEFPSTRTERLTGNGTLAAAIFACCVSAAALSMLNSYAPSAGDTLMIVIVVTILVIAARYNRQKAMRPAEATGGQAPLILFVATALLAWGYWLLNLQWVMYFTSPLEFFVVEAAVALALFSVVCVNAGSGRSDVQRFSLLLGLVSFYIFIDFRGEFVQRDSFGILAATIPFLVFLFLLSEKIRRSGRQPAEGRAASVES